MGTIARFERKPRPKPGARRRRSSVPPWLPLAALVGFAAVVWVTTEFRLDRFVSIERFVPIAGSTWGGRFTMCVERGQRDCVIDGDTIRQDGIRIRLADIDAPETHPPRCASEAALGLRATRRLLELVNAGTFELVSGSRDIDIYGRKLRVLQRDGRSLGAQLVAEGLARPWDGSRHPWC